MRVRRRWARERLGRRFEAPELLERALTHRSASSNHNERLEYLGDALLGFVISECLYDRHRDAPEGELTQLRAALVKGETLAEVARELGVADHLVTAPGQIRAGGVYSTNVLAGALEALLGAVYLDGGLEAARQCVRRLFDRRLAELPDASSLKDPKSRLQEWLQTRGLDLPRYVLESAADPHREPPFVVVCRVDPCAPQARGESSASPRMRRGARPAGREEGECRVSSTDESRRQPGCGAARMQGDLRHELLEARGRGPTRRGAEQEAARRMLTALTGE